VGICFGHQLLATALRGHVKENPGGWRGGVRSVSIQKQKEWMTPFGDDLNIIVSHHDSVDQLPPDATLLGSSSYCRNFMFSIDNRVLGIQGHPELSREFAKALYESKKEKIGPEKVERAIQSLGEKTSPALWANWIYAFLKQK
ncbi:MAG: hypothetical protein MI892_19795, partial [Desulfobacterales bacterium]|nr:hypothetical protein [Desulfobacterales bacterium]